MPAGAGARAPATPEPAKPEPKPEVPALGNGNTGLPRIRSPPMSSAEEHAPTQITAPSTPASFAVLTLDSQTGR